MVSHRSTNACDIKGGEGTYPCENLATATNHADTPALKLYRRGEGRTDLVAESLVKHLKCKRFMTRGARMRGRDEETYCGVRQCYQVASEQADEGKILEVSLSRKGNRVGQR